MEDYTDIINELGAYFRSNNQEVRNTVYQKAQVTKYTRKITKVAGRFPAFHSVLGPVIRKFSTTWQGTGTTSFRLNDLKDFHFKVNHPIIPANVKTTWLGEVGYDESKGMPEQTIAEYIMEKELMPAIIRDLEKAIGRGDTASVDQILETMDGLTTLFTRGISNTSGSEGGMFRIPLTGSMTTSNALDLVQTFEDTLDEAAPQISDEITKIFMSSSNRRKVLRDDKATNGKDTDYMKDGRKYTYEGNREIIGLDCLNGTPWIFATPDNNFLELMDINKGQAPRLTDIQKFDYELKLFFEWWLGIAFWTDQLVFVSNFANAVKGLGTAADDILYYGQSFK